jgi:hypothetical protein
MGRGGGSREAARSACSRARLAARRPRWPARPAAAPNPNPAPRRTRRPQGKVVNRSGLGDETCVTPAIANYVTGMAYAREEFETTCFSVVEELLAKTGVEPRRIRFLVTNSSLFNPTPSLGAMIMNRFKMGPKTQNFSLGGMGCSAGVIALDLAKQLLEHNPGEYCLVVSHENITNAHYKGRDRSMLVSNCIFRANGAAMLLSSRPSDAGRAKYRLRHVVRTNLAADDQAFGCVMQMDDDEGKVCSRSASGGGGRSGQQIKVGAAAAALGGPSGAVAAVGGWQARSRPAAHGPPPTRALVPPPCPRSGACAWARS